MHITLDHLMAVIISSVILLIFALVQVRGTQTSTEATINHIVFDEAMSMNEYLQSDFENILNQTQAENAMGAGAFSCLITRDGADNFLAFTFPTLNPDSLNSDPTNWDAIQVTYTLNPTGDTLQILESGSTIDKPLFSLERAVNGVYSGGSQAFVTDFTVEITNRGTVGFQSVGPCANTMRKIRFSYKLATVPVDFATNDQRATSNTNMSRFGSTVHLSNYANQ